MHLSQLRNSKNNAHVSRQQNPRSACPYVDCISVGESRMLCHFAFMQTIGKILAKFDSHSVGEMREKKVVAKMNHAQVSLSSEKVNKK